MALLETLTDSFTKPQLDTARWLNQGQQCLVTSNQLRLSFPSGLAQSSAYSVVETPGGSQTRKLNGSYFYARITPSNASTTHSTGMYLRGFEQYDRIEMEVRGGGLTAKTYVNSTGTTTNYSFGSYSASAHAYWRIRQTSGTLYFETSPNATTWTIQSAIPMPNFVAQNWDAGFQLYENNTAGSTAAALAIISEVNGGDRATSALKEDFSAGSPGGSGIVIPDQGLWQTTGTNGLNSTTAVNLVGGEGRFYYANSASMAIATSRMTYNAIGSNVTVKVVPPVNYSSGSNFYLTLLDVSTVSTSGQISLYSQNGNLYAETYSVSGTSQTTDLGVYNPTLARYWMIEVTLGNVCNWKTSPDGVTWSLRTSRGVSTAAAVKVKLMAYNFVGNQTGVYTAVDDLNATVAYVGTANPSGITDTDTLTGPSVDYLRAPAGIVDAEAMDNPSAAWSRTANPGGGAAPGLKDVDTVGTPTVSQTPIPDSINDGQAIGTPAVSFMPDKLAPTGVEDLGPLGTPALTFREFYNGGYGRGLYGQGLYGSYYIGPDEIVDPDNIGQPAVGAKPTTAPATVIDGEVIGVPVIGGTAVPSGIVPGAIGDTETLGAPAVSLMASGGYSQGLYGQGLYGQGQTGGTTQIPDTPTGETNYRYGAGTYGEGVHYGLVGAGSDTNPTENPTYGSGTYGYGIYFGTAVTVPDALPLFANTAYTYPPAMHILGIGPWSPVIQWRGAANYGVGSGNLPARPALPMPPATSKSFTLRLDEGGEATVDLQLNRGDAIVIDEMDTDLWWRRKDPRTKQVEMIGRFNTSHANVSTNDSGVSVSLQFDDYKTVLGSRLVLRYLHPTYTKPVTQWLAGTLVTEILAWALPGNTRLDLSEVTGENPYALGKITETFDIPLGTSIADVMENLISISPIAWEWWVDTPNNINEAPKLRFALGTRGTFKGVVLFDLGKGPSPIASWTRNAAAGNYANSLFYEGGVATGQETGGGVVKTIPAQIIQYGQRDAIDGNSSVTEIGLIRKRAQAKLQRLASRQPTYTINLASGYWRGRSHIDVGDTVRLLIRMGKEVIDEKHRVTEINVSIDANGAEEVTLTLGVPLPSPDPRSQRSPMQRLVRYLKSYQTPTGKADLPTPDN